LGLRDKVNFTWTKYSYMKKINNEMDAKELKEGGAAAAKKRRQREIAIEKAKKKAEALPEAVKVKLVEDLAAATAKGKKAVFAFVKGIAGEVNAALKAVRDAARDSKIKREKKNELKAVANLAQRKYLELRKMRKAEQDKAD